MRDYRLGNGVTACYHSIEEMTAAIGKPVKKRTSDAEKLKSQQEKFREKYRCAACNEPMTYVFGANVMACTNEKCAGIKKEWVDKEGNTKVTYLPSYDLLNGLGAEIANNIFA